VGLYFYTVFVVFCGFVYLHSVCSVYTVIVVVCGVVYLHCVCSVYTVFVVVCGELFLPGSIEGHRGGHCECPVVHLRPVYPRLCSYLPQL
jgi:hypothetical protein